MTASWPAAKQCQRSDRIAGAPVGGAGQMVPVSQARSTRAPIMNRDAYSIVATCGAEYRGIVQYQLLAGNV
jgi:hypothetical protein